MNADNDHKPKGEAMEIRYEIEKPDKEELEARYVKIFNLITRIKEGKKDDIY